MLARRCTVGMGLWVFGASSGVEGEVRMEDWEREGARAGPGVVRLYRELAPAHADAFRPNFSMSLSMLYRTFCEQLTTSNCKPRQCPKLRCSAKLGMSWKKMSFSRPSEAT
jgi:hypothetical protein